jgi:hypothetical protein
VSAVDRAYNRFLRKYAEDAAAGGPRDSAAYLAEFAPAAEKIADFLGAEAPPAASAEAVRTFGPYRLERLLGRGGQGAVHLAFDPRLGRRVALKTLHAATGWSAADKARLKREAAVAAQLEHPGLCAVYEAGEIDDVPYLAMRYVEGTPLDRRVDAARTPPRAAFDHAAAPVSATLVEEIARALHHAHERGFVHRDVKPSNVIVGADGKPVLVDFGLARRAGADAARLTMTGEVAGTPAYLAPEQLVLPTDQVDGRADVYALGVVLFELLAGRQPFIAPNTEALLRATLDQAPPSLTKLRPGAPRGYATVLEVALAKERERRYPTAVAFADDLARVARGEPPLARPPGLTVRLAAAIRRRRAVVAASVLAVIAAGAAVWWRYDAGAEKDRGDKASQMAKAERRRGELKALALRINQIPAGSPQWRALKRGDLVPLDAAITALEEGSAASAEMKERILVLEEEVVPGNAAVVSVGGESATLADELRLLENAVGLLVEASAPDPSTSWLASLRMRRDWIAKGRDEALERGRAAWRAAIATIADERRMPRYRGERLAPQPGLTPLGPNAGGLYEFLDLWTTLDPTAPSTDLESRASGEGNDEARRGVVLVLIPRGDDPGEAPFFIAKYELTRRLVARLMLREPGYADAGVGQPDAVRETPRPSSSAESAADWALRAGLRLPKESEWRRAAAAAHRSAKGGERAASRTSALRPAGVGAADANGLHDVLDNVAEWCFLGDGKSRAVFDGLSLEPGGAGRRPDPPTGEIPFTGVRPARDVVVD